MEEGPNPASPSQIGVCLVRPRGQWRAVDWGVLDGYREHFARDPDHGGLEVVGKLLDIQCSGGDDDLELRADAYGFLQQTCERMGQSEGGVETGQWQPCSGM